METRAASKRYPFIDDVGEVSLRGLVNLGCSCYINCVLQVLVHTPAIAEFCLGETTTAMRCTVETCLICQLAPIALELRSPNRTPLSVPRFLRALWTVEPEFSDGGMHDAHDFWLRAVDAFTRHPGGEKLLKSLLEGEVQSTLRCEVCGHTSRRVETVMDHSLSLKSQPISHNRTEESSRSSSNDDDESVETFFEPEENSRKHGRQRCGACDTCLFPKKKKGCLRNKKLRSVAVEEGCDDCKGEATVQGSSRRRKSLEQCLAESHRVEIVHLWMCDHCGCFRNAVKETQMTRLPKLLAVHLKRFDFNSQTRRSKKLDMHVACPAVLDIATFNPLPLNSEKLWNYHLVAIIAHRGSLNGGHYWTYLQKNDQWFKLNDAVVKQVQSSEVAASQAYMIFYEKRHRLPPRGPVRQE